MLIEFPDQFNLRNFNPASSANWANGVNYRAIPLCYSAALEAWIGGEAALQFKHSRKKKGKGKWTVWRSPVGEGLRLKGTADAPPRYWSSKPPLMIFEMPAALAVSGLQQNPAMNGVYRMSENRKNHEAVFLSECGEYTISAEYVKVSSKASRASEEAGARNHEWICWNRQANQKMEFGSNAGLTYRQVLETKPGYVEWMRNQAQPGVGMTIFLKWAKELEPEQITPGAVLGREPVDEDFEPDRISRGSRRFSMKICDKFEKYVAEWDELPDALVPFPQHVQPVVQELKPRASMMVRTYDVTVTEAQTEVIDLT